MDAKHWQQVSELFDQAMEIPEKEREAFLNTKCDGDPALKREVVKLLKADADADSLQSLDRKLSNTLIDPRPKIEMPSPGDRLDRYKLLHEIGAGGMGVVYLADDEDLKRRVAVKLIGGGRATEEAQYRQRIESQVLANLDHSNIAVLHDSGTTREGLSYFVMEYVEGIPIDAYCDQNELTTDQRVDLFLKVCDAVESAHRGTVVHRDIKPSNILVTEGGVVKLLDFGIAKLLEPDLLGVETEATAEWKRLLTLDYASVEQIQGRPVNVASDVYSLGVLLFKLLTGQLPFCFDFEGALSIEQQALEREPPRASEVLQGRDKGRLARELAGDLDSILIKALRSSLEHRYGTVSQLVDDLQRQRQNLPVLARKGNLRYQAGKFLRRHRVSMGVAALLATFTVVTLLQVVRVQQERVRADQERVRADDEQRTKAAVVDLVVSLFETADLYLNQGDELTVRQALVHAEERLGVDQLDAEVQITLREVVGKVYLSIGDQDSAAEQFRLILESQTRLHGENSLESATARSLYATALRYGQIEDAIQEGERAVETIRHLGGESSREMAVPLNRLLTTYCLKNDHEAAAPWTQRALAITKRWFGAESAETARALTNSAMVLKKQGHLAEASKGYQEALAIMQRRFSPTHPYALNLTGSMASVARAEGEWDKSVEIYEKLIDTQGRVYRGDHPDIFRTLYNLSVVLLDQGKIDESLERFRQAIQILRSALGPDHPDTIESEIRLAKRLIKVDRPAEAKDLLTQRLPGWHGLDLSKSPLLIPKAEEALAKAEAVLANIP